MNKKKATAKVIKQIDLFATCPKGLEQLLEEELISLGANTCKQTVAGVRFRASMAIAYKVCLWSRLANRILLSLGSFPVQDARDLYQAVARINWQDHLDPNGTLRVDFNGKSESINNTQFAAQTVKDAIVDQFKSKLGCRPSVDKLSPDVRINGVLRKGYVALSIDLSGESLHRRGYRLEVAAAPLKENLAAALLLRAKWPEIAKQGGSLVDLMCGSGTLLIEGYLMAADIAPGLFRKQFGFHRWKQYQEALWLELVEEATQRAERGKQELKSQFHGFDKEPDYLEQAQANVNTIALTPYIQLELADIAQNSFLPSKGLGLCIINPPYGERMSDVENLYTLYRALSDKLKKDFLGWEAAIFTGNAEVARRMGLRAYKKYALFNGSIPCQLLLFHVQQEWFIDKDERP